MIGQTEILIICGVVILLFGASAIPKLARSIGKAKREFREGLKEGEESKGSGESEGAPVERKADKKQDSE